MTEKARKVRARLVRRPDITGMTEMCEGEDRLAGNSEEVVKTLGTRAPSPYVLIDIEEVMRAVRYRDGGRKARAGSPFVLVEAEWAHVSGRPSWYTGNFVFSKMLHTRLVRYSTALRCSAVAS